MNERIKELYNEVAGDDKLNFDSYLAAKFAELIVRICADAADDAYYDRCMNPGDYVGEQLGYGKEHGITAWRCGVEE
jgi:hypothetical protein